MTDVFAPNLLAGQHAFVTGGTSGINLAIATRFIEAGARVTILGRNVEKAAAAAASIGARAATADVRDFAALSAQIDASVAEYGPLDIVVAGAAGNFPAPAMGISSNGFKAVIDIDLLGAFHACRAAFPHLKKPGGSILTISATQSFTPAMMQAHVCAAKAGIDQMVKVLAMEWGPSGVRVNSIAPGPIADTVGMDKLAPDEAMRAKATAAIPLRRFGTKREIADLALFLSSSAASYITGALFVADGGQSLSGYGAIFG
ncbi:MAG TPA: SDR family oxidoreductase [Kofleriaceae bacterium]|jgi:NAD(P)-dependent dehydrogenase (short-subunit alcohol dehydrogenase family)